jgi:hypothetical protein
MRIAVVVGGTFTDVIVLDEATNTPRLETVKTMPHGLTSGCLIFGGNPGQEDQNVAMSDSGLSRVHG